MLLYQRVNELSKSVIAPHRVVGRLNYLLNDGYNHELNAFLVGVILEHMYGCEASP